MRIGFFSIAALAASLAVVHASDSALSEERDSEALKILNDSPWSRQLTVTRVVSGVGSGEYGEKEIFSRYYVRILSAPAIQDAYARIRDRLNPQDSAGQAVSESYVLDPRYILVGVAFRSNQPDLEGEVLNTFRSQTVESLKNRAFLSTARFPQLQLIAYYPPSEAAVGAQFVFSRTIGGQPVVSREDESFAFELDLPGDDDIPQLRVTFPVTDGLLVENSGPGQPEDQFSAEEAVTEFRISGAGPSNSVNLESSRLAGLVNLFPQQRTGRPIHGSIYEYHRNDNLDARNFFDPTGRPLPEFKRNQFGFSLAADLGPRLDVFGSFDGLRIIQGSTLLSNVPSPAMKSGDFSELLSLTSPVQLVDPISGGLFPGNRIPPERIHPVARKLLPLIPNPNRDEDVRNFVNSQPVVQDENTTTVRVDYGLNQVSQISTQFMMQDGADLEVHPFPAFGAREIGREYEASASYARTFADNTIATWRVGFDRTEELETSRQERPAGLLDSLGIAGVMVEGPEDEGYPVFELAGYPGFGDERLPQREVENRYRLGGDLTLGRGEHLLKFSGSLGFRQLNDSRSNSIERGDFGFSGVYSGHAFADFLLGRADTATRAIGSSRQDLRSRNFQLAVTDEWRVQERFTLTLGLEYEYWAPFRSIHSNIAVFRPLLFEPPEEGRLFDLGVDPVLGMEPSATVVRPDRNDFSPRVGFALRPFGSGRFVIRGSYGISYEPVPSYIYENYMGRNYPYYFLQSSQASVDSSGLDLGAPFDTGTPTELAVRDIVPDLRTPYRHGWDVSLQHEITDNWTLEFTHRGRRSLKELRVIPANVPLPGPDEIQSRRPNPDYGQFGLVSGGGSSLFYEFQVDLQRRFSNGFTFDTAFEVRRRFDDEFPGHPSNPRLLAAEWAPGGEFEDRRFRLNFIYDLPFGKGRALGEVPGVDSLLGGWRLSGIGRITSGLPFTVLLPGDPNNDGLSSDRPDRIASGRLPDGQRSIDQWFDPTAFAEPEPFSFGDAGRNILVGPSYHNWDISLVKDIVLAKDHRLQVRFAFFNAFNHTNFANPNRVYGTRTFGVITAARRAREIEIALKYSF